MGKTWLVAIFVITAIMINNSNHSNNGNSSNSRCTVHCGCLPELNWLEVPDAFVSAARIATFGSRFI